MALAFLVILYTYLALVAALSKEQWRSQSIYQLLTDRYARTNGDRSACADLGKYCGGTWQGIINNLDYIQNMGFTAVWISPITEQIQGSTYYGDAYHGFWPQKINQLNSNFGTAADLKALSNALHQRGMYLMVDMVANDMAWNGAHNTVDYTQFDVFNDQSYYHPYCQVTDYQNATNAEECWTGDDHLCLPDLNTESATVISKWQSWVQSTVQTYGIDGIRLDACLELNKQFFPSFESAAGVYIVCEVYNYPVAGVCDYQNYVSGLLNFPIWYLVVAAFGSNSGNIANLYNGITQMQGSCKDVSLLGNFVENHDVNRFPYNTTDSGLDQNAIAFVMLNDGIPIIYAGEEQYYAGGSPPADRETTWTSNYDTTNIYYQLIKKINLFRSCVIAKDSSYLTAKSVPFFLDTQVLAVKKGSSAATQVVGVFNNRGTNAIAYTINLSNTGWTAGQQVYEIYTNQTVTVDSGGNLPVYMYGGQPRIYYLLSGQCYGNTTTPVARTTTSIQPTSTAISTTRPASSSPSVIPPSTTPGTPAVPPSSTPSLSATPPSSTPSSTPSLSAVPPSSTPSTSALPPTTTPGSSAIPSSSPPGSTPGATPSSTTSSAVASVLPSSSSQFSSSSTSTASVISVAGVPSLSTSSLQIAPSSSGTSSVTTPASTASVSSVAAIPGTSNILSSPVQIPSSTSTSSTTSSTGAILLSTSSSPLGSSSTSTYVPISATPLISSGSTVPTPAPTSSVLLGAPTSKSPIPASLSPTVAQSTAPTPVTTPPVCPSADGVSFISNGHEFVVGCGLGSDQAYYTQRPGNDIADCVHICTTYAGPPACEAVTYNNGVCYLKTQPGAVHHEDGSDSAFVISTPSGPETIISGFLSGNISHTAPSCPVANGNTFESNGYIYVVGCTVDNFVVDVFTSSGADLASCVESCITYSGTASCVAVTHNNGTCHLKASVGTVYHATDSDSAFIIANQAGVNPVGTPSGPPLFGPSTAGSPSITPNPAWNPPTSPYPTYTVTSECEVIVYMPLNEVCPG